MIKTETIKTPTTSASCINLDTECFNEIFIIHKGKKYKVNKDLLMYYLKRFSLIDLQVGDGKNENS